MAAADDDARETASRNSAFRNLRVVDLGAGMSAALVAKQLAELGALVDRWEPESGDPFHDVYPAYRFWHRSAPICESRMVGDLLAHADICILGGEDFPGREGISFSREALSRDYPRLIVLDLIGAPGSLTTPMPAVDLLVQARLGIVHEQYSARPNLTAFPMPSYGAALLGLIGTLACLIEREKSGRGQIVTASLVAGGAMFWGPFWMTAERQDEGFRSITPRDVRHLTLRCSDAKYVQITMAVPGAVARVHSALKIEGTVNAADRGMPDKSRGPAAFFGDVDLFSRHSRGFDQATLLRALRDNGVPAEAVLDPGECWDDDQLRCNGLIHVDPEGWSYVGSPISFTDSAAPVSAVREAPVERASDVPPLSGIRVVDCGIFVAGPYAAKLLGDYGADIIRLEPPTGPATLSGERTIISANVGKRSIRIDAKTVEGQEVIARLCQTADVVVNNFRPGVSKRLGLDPLTLRQSNPTLITLETTAYGAQGPKAQAPGFDMIMQAHCGLQSRAGGEGNPPLCTRTPMVDFAAGAIGAIAVLAALFENARTGRALSAETNLLNVGTWMMSELVRDPKGNNLGAQPLNCDQTGFHPAECLYRTVDGWVAVAARTNAMSTSFAAILGVNAPPCRRDWGEPEHAGLTEAMSAMSTNAVLDSLRQAGVWAQACVPDGWKDILREGQILRDLDDPDYGHVQHCVGPLLHFSRSETVPVKRLSCPTGSHSRKILDELGYTARESTNLETREVAR